MANLKDTTMTSLTVSGGNAIPGVGHEGWKPSSDFTYLNGWGDYGDANYAPPVFTKWNGWVHIIGLIAGGTVAANTNLLQMPVGYRIKQNGAGNTSANIISTWSSAGIAELRILPDGYLELELAIANSSWFSIQCSYYAGN